MEGGGGDGHDGSHGRGGGSAVCPGCSAAVEEERTLCPACYAKYSEDLIEIISLDDSISSGGGGDVGGGGSGGSVAAVATGGAVERRLRHPAVAALAEVARDQIFGPTAG